MQIASPLRFVLLAAVALMAWGCNKGNSDVVVPDGSFTRGAYILNRGTVGGNDATLNFFTTDGRVQQNDIYTTLIGRPLGDNPTSIAVHNGKTYMLMSGSNRIEVVAANTVTDANTISGINNPRYLAAPNNDKAYVSEWTDMGGLQRGNVVVLNLNTRTVTRRITVGRGPERILLFNGRAYITSHATANETRVYVVNTDTDQLIDSITVSANPTSAAVDANGLLWVACAGNYNSGTTSYTDTSRIVRINANTKVVQQTHRFVIGRVPTQLQPNHNSSSMYFMMDNAVWRFDVAASFAAKIINRSFASIAYDGRFRLLYAAVSAGNSTPGRALRYRGTDNGVQDSITVGIAPVGFAFNYAE